MKYGLGVRRLLAWLVVTLLLGLGFLGLEMHDFVTMINAGAGPSRSGFLSSYFTLVSTHGLHVLAGCVWLVVMMVQIVRFGFDRQTKTGLLCLGLFWHFLDIVWVGLFSLIFLQGLIG
jgi:cytochrome o ubiquinol oxidase subunit 3